MRALHFVDGNYYHIFNRGVEKRVIFEDQTDFQRFYSSMYLFNDVNYINTGGNTSLRDEGLKQRLRETGKEMEKFVEILSYCLVPNHFHFFVQQNKEHGIVKFMHRLSMGYARYFNLRHERTGRLFEGSFKAVAIERDEHFMHLPRYIHLNALDQSDLNWRDGKIVDWEKAETFLDNYPWSSHRAYKGLKESLPITALAGVREIFPTVESYVAFLKEWSGRYNQRLLET